MLVYAYLRLFVCYRVCVTLTLPLFVLCWQTYALLKKYIFSIPSSPYCLLFLHLFVNLCLFSGLSCTERVSESTDSVSVVGGVLSLIIILIIGVSALVIIILLIKIQNLKAMLTQAKE